MAEETRNSSFGELGEQTCCHRATCCCACMRDVLVTRPFLCCVFEHFTVATVFWLVTVSVLLGMAYALLCVFFRDIVYPGGPIFGLFGTVVFAYALGWLLAYLPYLNLPPVFGMLLAGIIVRNCGWYDISVELGMRASSHIRNFSVTFVLLRAGLQLTSSALREHPLFVFNLAVVPCTMELVTVAIFCKFCLGYTWGWAFLCGSVVACMSPVVPLNCMLSLAERGYGEDKEIASLLFAAVSIDDIHVISVYAICYSFIFTHNQEPKSWLNYIPGGFRDLLAGFVIGTALGLFLVFFPHRASDHVLTYRIIGLILGSMLCTVGASSITITGGGFLAVIIMSLIATNGWRILTVPYDVQPLRQVVAAMWHIVQPVLVGVIGAEIDLKHFSVNRLVYYMATLWIGLTVRAGFAYLATFHMNFSTKERLFIALSWISKGTLQAALGPMTLEQALADQDSEETFYASDIERIAVLSIIIFAPLGAIAMMVSGPRLLNKVTVEEQRRRRELSFMKIVSLQPVRK